MSTKKAAAKKAPAKKAAKHKPFTDEQVARLAAVKKKFGAAERQFDGTAAAFEKGIVTLKNSRGNLLARGTVAELEAAKI